MRRPQVCSGEAGALIFVRGQFSSARRWRWAGLSFHPVGRHKAGGRSGSGLLASIEVEHRAVAVWMTMCPVMTQRRRNGFAWRSPSVGLYGRVTPELVYELLAPQQHVVVSAVRFQGVAILGLDEVSQLFWIGDPEFLSQ